MSIRLRITALSAALVLLLLPGIVYADSAKAVIDKSLLDKGIIKVSYQKAKETNGIVRITKDKVNYDYTLTAGAQYPLQLGNGNYTIMVAEAVSGTKYKAILQEKLDLNLTKENDVFLQSIALLDWNNKTKAVVKALELTKNAKTDKDKVAAIYAYITKNFKYDYTKAKTVQSGYIPVLDDVYKVMKGICYDYASTFAAMTRSLGIPTKLVMGYYSKNPTIYHAWNQVYLKDTKEWITIDTTNDAVQVQAGKTTLISKKPVEYKISKFY
jgi:hypothetical protein